MCTYVNLSFVNVSMCPCTAWPVSPRYKWAKYCNVDHMGQSGWFKLKHFCRLSGKHDAIESLLQTLKECKTNQKHTSNQASPFYITTLQIEDVHLPSKSRIPVPQVNSDHGAYISVPVYQYMRHIIWSYVFTWVMCQLLICWHDKCLMRRVYLTSQLQHLCIPAHKLLCSTSVSICEDSPTSASLFWSHCVLGDPESGS